MAEACVHVYSEHCCQPFLSPVVDGFTVYRHKQREKALEHLFLCTR